MSAPPIADLVDALRQYQLLNTEQLEALLQHLQSRTVDSYGLALELMRQRWLTSFQANRLLEGQASSLVFGNYTILDLLGEGGMGQVFMARHRAIHRIDALKLIRGDRIQDKTTLRRFRQEIQAAARVLHPNIVLARNAGIEDGVNFLAMEYVDGVNLAAHVKEKGPLSVVESCHYIQQAATGLQHIHECGLVHRDIKPENLMLLSEKPLVKITDLGLARLGNPLQTGSFDGTLTRKGALMGTPDYMAPEQVEEAHLVDIRADIYSLGCTFFFLLTGQPPFAGGTFMQKVQKHQFATAPSVESLRPEVPIEIGDIIHKMMAKRPEERYQSPRELADILQRQRQQPRLEKPGATGMSISADVRREPPPRQDDTEGAEEGQSSHGGWFLVVALLISLTISIGGIYLLWRMYVSGNFPIYDR